MEISEATMGRNNYSLGPMIIQALVINQASQLLNTLQYIISQEERVERWSASLLCISPALGLRKVLHELYITLYQINK